jgi:16S rRNA (adenine1518-N6/adenine1519-N6)-dimethyltransferase
MTRPHRPRKRFGQHFLTDPGVVSDIVAAIAPRAGDKLVEIGPGRGAITDPLLRTGAELHAIEFDRDLAAELRLRYRDQDRFRLHEADALSFDFPSIGDDLRVVGNLPYNISTPLLFHLVDCLDSIRDMHFMLQKEVVDRMAAAPGNKRYGRLTVILGCYAETEALFDVPPQAFSPPPKVMSTVVRMTPRRDQPLEIADPALLGSLVAQAFSKRRKTLRNALRERVSENDFDAVGIDPGLRAETIPIDTWVALANRLAAAN